MICGFLDRKSYADAIKVSNEILAKCGVFDLKGSNFTLGLHERICNKRFPCPSRVLLYARMGLHRYNLLQGTKFHLICVKKYIVSTGSAVGSYYITLDATAGSSLQTFQTKVSEEEFGKFILRCNIATIRGDDKMISGFLDTKSHVDAIKASNKLLEKCGVFDLKGSNFTLGLHERICNKWFPCPSRVLLYARMGLHRYNLMQGTKFQLIRVKKYIVSTGSAAGSYYITLDATAGSSLQTFQTKVSEEKFGKFILRCNIARIRGETSHGKRAVYLGTSLPEWPPENPFENCYLVKESELQDNDWIRLYLELAVATTGRDYGLSNKLEIVNVAIDVVPPNDDGLNAKKAIIYIRYNDLYKAELGKDFDRIAIVRRSFDEDTGCFTLEGQNQSSEVIPKKPSLVANEGQNQSSEIIQFSQSFAENKRIKLNPTGLANQISSPLATCEDHEVANLHSRDEETGRESME